MDSVGIGEAPDAESLRDVGSDIRTYRQEAGLTIPHLGVQLGLGTIRPLDGVVKM